MSQSKGNKMSDVVDEVIRDLINKGSGYGLRQKDAYDTVGYPLKWEEEAKAKLEAHYAKEIEKAVRNFARKARQTGGHIEAQLKEKL